MKINLDALKEQFQPTPPAGGNPASVTSGSQSQGSGNDPVANSSAGAKATIGSVPAGNDKPEIAPSAASSSTPLPSPVSNNTPALKEEEDTPPKVVLKSTASESNSATEKNSSPEATPIKMISLNSKNTPAKATGVKLLSVEQMKQQKKEQEERKKNVQVAPVDKKTTLEVVMEEEPLLFGNLSSTSHQKWHKEKEKFRNYQSKKRKQAVKMVTPAIGLFALALILWPVGNNFIASLSGTTSQQNTNGVPINGNSYQVTQTNDNALHASANQNSTNTNENHSLNKNANTLAQTNRNNNPVTPQKFVTSVQNVAPQISTQNVEDLEKAFSNQRTLTVFEAVKASMETFNIPSLIPRNKFSPKDRYVVKFSLKNGIVAQEEDLYKILDDDTLHDIEATMVRYVTK